MAQRRNVEDPATIEAFADIVRSQENLDALMLVTLADGQGTSGQNWSDWKESLVWELYRGASSYLQDTEEFFRLRHIEREVLHQAVGKRMARDFGEEIEVHFHSMPERYFQSHNVNEIVSHLRLFRAFFEERVRDNDHALAAAVRWHSKPDQGHSESWVCTWDRAALMSKIAGAFATASINILSADVYTRRDNLMLGIFRVCDTNFQSVTEEGDQRQVESVLNETLKRQEYDFGPLLSKTLRRLGYHHSPEMDFPTKLTISNRVHPSYTVIDLQSTDRLGLLHDVLKCLSDAGINIVHSRIATEKGAAFDSFYVTDHEGRKLAEEMVGGHLQTALLLAATGEALRK